MYLGISSPLMADEPMYQQRCLGAPYAIRLRPIITNTNRHFIYAYMYLIFANRTKNKYKISLCRNSLIMGPCQLWARRVLRNFLISASATILQLANATLLPPLQLATTAILLPPLQLATLHSQLSAVLLYVIPRSPSDLFQVPLLTYLFRYSGFNFICCPF